VEPQWTPLVAVPHGFKAIIVSDQLLAQFEDWTPVPETCQARVVPTDNPHVVDVESRYVRTEPEGGQQ
jgi:hypothetical protein